MLIVVRIDDHLRLATAFAVGGHFLNGSLAEMSLTSAVAFER